MIETTIREVDGVRFYENIKILEPDDTIGGFGVHYIPDRLRLHVPELMRAIKLLGLKKVGRNAAIMGGSDTYAQFPVFYIGVKVAYVLLKIYWGTVRWLYDNARFFKQIPESHPFSWSYFTPYVWYRRLIKR